MAKDTRRVSGDLAAFIVNAVMGESQPVKDRKVVLAELPLLADKVYYAMIGKHRKTIESLPEGYLQQSESFTISRTTPAPANMTTNYNFTMSVSRRVPERCKGYYNGYEVQELSPECQEAVEEYRVLDLRCRALYAEIETLRAKTRAAVTGFRTINQLVEAWPEVAAFVPTPEEKSNAIAIAIPELNGLLGLLKKAA